MEQELNVHVWSIYLSEYISLIDDSDDDEAEIQHAIEASLESVATSR